MYSRIRSLERTIGQAVKRTFQTVIGAVLVSAFPVVLGVSHLVHDRGLPGVATLVATPTVVGSMVAGTVGTVAGLASGLGLAVVGWTRACGTRVAAMLGE